MATIVTASGSISSMSALMGSETHRRLNSLNKSTGLYDSEQAEAHQRGKLAQWKYPVNDNPSGNSSLASSTSSSVADSTVSLSSYTTTSPVDASSFDHQKGQQQQQSSWRNTTEAPSCSPLRPLVGSAAHRTSPSMPYGHRPSASSSSASARRAGGSSGSTSSPLRLLLSLAQRRWISWIYQSVFFVSVLVFFAALAGVGYAPPQSLELMPIATELESRHPPVDLAAAKQLQAMESDRLATVVRPQGGAAVAAGAGGGGEDAQPFPALEDEEDVSPMHAHIEAAHQQQQQQQQQQQPDWIQDSPVNMVAEDEVHVGHVHQAAGAHDNIFGKGRLAPEGHVDHQQPEPQQGGVDGDYLADYQVRGFSPEEPVREQQQQDRADEAAAPPLPLDQPAQILQRQDTDEGSPLGAEQLEQERPANEQSGQKMRRSVRKLH